MTPATAIKDVGIGSEVGPPEDVTCSIHHRWRRIEELQDLGGEIGLERAREEDR